MKLRALKFILSVVCFLNYLNEPALAQTRNTIDNIKFEQLSEGLSEKSVTCMLQDRKGFIWFGTRNGLNRYDGVAFKIYEFIYGDSTSLSGNFINSLVEDSVGNIWVGTMDAGLNLYDRARDIFIRYQPNAGDPNSLSDNWISDLYRDSHNNLWIGTEKEGLDLLEPGSTIFQHFKRDPNRAQSLINNHVRVTFEDAKLNLWVGTYGGGLDLFDRKQNRFIHHRHDPTDETSISSDYLYSYLTDSDGNTWVGTREGLNLIIPGEQGFTFKRYKPNIMDPTGLIHNIVLSVAEDNEGRLWIGMENGALTIYDKKAEKFTNFWPDPLDPTSIGSNSIWSIFADNMGTIWMGARNRGINKWDQYHTKFVHHILPPSGDHKLANNDVLCFVEDKTGNLWIGTDGGGLNYLDRKTNRYTHYVHDPQNSKSLSSNSVISLELDSYGDLWIGTWEGGLNRFNKNEGTFHHYYHNPGNPKSIGSNYVFSIFEDSDRKLWVGAFYEGLDLYDRKSDSFIHYKRDINDPTAIGHNRVFTMYEDSKKNLWIGTEGGGLIHMDRGNEKPIFTTYRHNPNDSTSLSSNLINAIYEDSRNNLWIGTWVGLNKFDYQSRTFEAFRKEDGLADNVVYGIVEDTDGNFWVSTNQGISKFDPVKILFENYNTADGLQAQEFIRGSFLKSKSGEFFFGGVNGFNSFFPKEILDNPYVPPVYITNFWIYNDLIRPGINSPLKSNITETETIVLTYNQNEFSFEFAALNYSQAFKNTYSYFLEGYDKTWRFSGTQRKATYAKVPPGEYTFRVKATNNDGIWNEKGAFLKIIVNPPWWKSWWAYSVYAVTIVALFLWYRQNLINRERLRNDLKLEHLELTKMQEMDKLKSYFFANISHEFRTPLTLILSPIRDMFAGNFKGDAKKQYLMVIRNGERLLRLINQLLDLSKLGAGSMKLKASQLDIVNFLKPIVSAFDSYAQKAQVKFKFEYPLAPVMVYLDADKFEKIITNLLSNAFKFTREGEIRLSVRIVGPVQDKNLNQASDNKVEVAVEDSGAGIPQEYISSIFDHFYQVAHHSNSEGTGIGLSLTKELVELHKGKIMVESEVGKGSTFKVILLLGKDHLKEAEIDDSDGPIFASDKTFAGVEPVAIGNLPQFEALADTRLADRPRILIIEDNIDMRTYIRQSLDTYYLITESGDGKDGLRKSLEIIPDLIISDVMMPGMDGVELCRSLKTNIYTSHIPVILLTAKADLESKIEGLETGADEYLSKPFNSYELQVRSKNLIRSREILRKRFTESKKLILEPKEISITSLDEKFLKNVLQIIEKNISDSDFKVETLGKELDMDHMPMYRKIKALTGQTAVEFIRTIRLKRAAQLLKQQKLTVAEVTYNVGFNDLQYFRSCFKKQFGVSPSEYMTRLDSVADV